MTTTIKLARLRASARWIGGAAVMFALACAGSSGPGDGSDSDLSGRGTFGEQIDEPGIAGRQSGEIARGEQMGFEAVYFEFDQHNLREDAKDALRRNHKALRENPHVRVEIQGNCDERGSEEYNLALGERRASAAREYLVGLGIPVDRITIVSFGETNPAVSGHDESAWARNRRDDFAVIP